MKKIMKQVSVAIERLAPAVLLAVFMFEFGFPYYAVAADTTNRISAPLVFRAAEPSQPIDPAVVPVQEAVVVPELKVIKTYRVPMTAYNSLAGQTDSTPCIPASGLDLCKHNTEDVVAANFLPLHTKIRIPELYGDQIFTVEDRMNKRYGYRVDIWMKERKSAMAFGLKKNVLIEVVE